MDIKGKKIDQLISEGIIPNNPNAIPMIGTQERDAFEELIKSTDAYAKYISKLTEAQLSGSEKQVSWAKQIRDEKAETKAFEMVMTLIDSKISPALGIDFNKYANRVIAEFKVSNAAWWISNRF